MELDVRASWTDDAGPRPADARPVRPARRTSVVRRRTESAPPGPELMRDPATGLVPRLVWWARLRDQLALGLPVGLVAVGIDVAGHPHPIDDGTLVAMVAKRLTSDLRDTDVMADFSGDGFLVTIADAPAPEVLHAVARRLVAAASGPLSVMADRIEVRASASFALVAAGDADAERVVARAVRAWRRARSLGGERVAAFDPLDDDVVAERAPWTAEELERALQAGEFEAWFQPVVDVASADLAGFEAFLRWAHPELGLLEPARFLADAEEAGLLGRIGTEVMRQAMRHLARWDARVPDRPLTIGVNLSPRQLALPDLAETIGDLVAAAGVTAERVRVDVAEATVDADPEAVAAQLTALRRHGVRVCLDDFGAGSASMGLLQKVPFDVVKLHRRLLEGIEAEPARVVLEAIVRFGRSIGVTVLAEGVETPRELSVLRQAGCDQAQGRLFSGARRAHEIDAMLDRWLGVAADRSPGTAPMEPTAPAAEAASGEPPAAEAGVDVPGGADAPTETAGTWGAPKAADSEPGEPPAGI